jgi:hypothetical protein
MREFTSFGGFGRHLASLAVQGDAVAGHATKLGAEVIKDDAQWRIGAYQDEVGPFNAWAPLAHSTVMDRTRKGFTPFDPLLRTGGLRDSIVVDVSGTGAVVASSSDIAFFQEIGTQAIPPRPSLGPAGMASKHKVAEITAVVLVAWLCGSKWQKPQSIKLP